MTDAESGMEPFWYDKIQKKIYLLLESPADDNKARKLIIYFIAAMILLNVLVVILETKHELFIEYESYFTVFDLFTVVVFSIEYALRVWVCVRNPKYSSPVKGRIRFALSPLALVDLIAITPFYLPLIIPIEFRTLRLLRLLRIFRVLRLCRYSNAFETFADVLKSKKEEIVITIIMAVIILTLASSALYAVEREAQPEKFASIMDAMWWAVVTLATVGYGDVYPITPLGKFITALVALSAIGLFALPAGILASGFAESFQKKRTIKKATTQICPHCGKEFTIHSDIVPDNSEKTGSSADVALESDNSENNSE
jgi:voltage-gated potassium channel